MPTRTELANAIRFLSMDAIEKAQSGHPGMPMGMADIAEVLWRDFLSHSPSNPNWHNRDRFILSNGHGSMLLYSVLHLTGYDVSIDDLKAFRQFGSKTPGHPEYGYTPGVETTTGPLGQGIGNAVGMALAEQLLAAEFNRPDYPIIDHYTWVFAGDGCLMEGVSHEVCSLAGTWGLGKLIVFYDNNGISIDGNVEGWFSDDTPERFRAYGWQVIPNVHGHDPQEIITAIKTAKQDTSRPTLICCKTRIGFGAPNKQGSHDVHGSPLGTAEIAAARNFLKWPYEPFVIPTEISAAWNAVSAGSARESAWNTVFTEYATVYPELASEFTRRMAGNKPTNWDDYIKNIIEEANRARTTVATRKASQHAIEALAHVLPELLGGSADLTPSNLTHWRNARPVVGHNTSGNYIHYGVREFGMATILIGLTLHKGFKAFGATFLMFSEYARNALRMAALMQINPIFVFTHDSVGLGEDGPTHQPIEQLATLRMIPNMVVWRPCDTVETMVAWADAIESNDRPTCLIFSRQNLPFIERSDSTLPMLGRGGYVLRDMDKPQAVLIATGSEVSLALNAQSKLAEEGIRVRVVSMPSTTLFDQQDQAWQKRVLPEGIPRIAIEAGSPDFWHKYVGLEGRIIGINQFGASAPAQALFESFGFTVENVVAETKKVVSC